jgi:hypothetical protein
MTSTWLPWAIVALAVLLASIRLCQRPRPAPARLSALLLLQAVAAVLLCLALSPPPRSVRADTLVIATAGAREADVLAIPAATHLRLPEAPSMSRVAAVPDLATAMRQHPGTRELVIVGDGLIARDRDAPLPPALRFLANPAPAGLVELRAPPLLAPGARFEVGSRVHGLRDVRVELLDPAGHRVAITTPGSDGRVRLVASAREPGDVSFALRLLDADGKVRDQLPVPVRVRAVPPPSLRLLAGAPGPELKYLQRWAADTGASQQTSILVGGGVQLGDAPAALDAASLAKIDLLVLDERRLAALSPLQRNGVNAAMRAGLGVLVRMGGPLDAGARRALREWGLDTRGGQELRPLKFIDGAAGDGSAEPFALERFTLDVVGDDAVPLLRDAEGNAVGQWRALGLGRVGVLPVSDSYSLVLAGHAPQHAALWNQVLATLARPLPTTPSPELAGWGWAGERNVLCGLPSGAQAIAPDGARSALLADPQAGNCSGWWPTQAGWHTFAAGSAQATMLLLEPQQARALHATQQRDATLALRGTAGTAQAAIRVPGPRWPWLLAFVLVAALLWWLERRKPVVAAA